MQELRRIEHGILDRGRVDSDHLEALRLALYAGGAVGRPAADALVELSPGLPAAIGPAALNPGRSAAQPPAAVGPRAHRPGSRSSEHPAARGSRVNTSRR